MRQHRQLSTQGFTVIELLIVIGVIGILAIITVVSYNGIRERSYNTKILDGVQQYADAIDMYKTMHGHYPATSGETNGDYLGMACVGTGYPNNTCGTVSGKTIIDDPAFNDAMATVIGSAPSIGSDAIQVQGESFVGAVYGIDTTNITPRGRTIQYALLGKDADCVLRGAVGYNVSTTPPTTACEIYLEPYP